MVKKLKLSKLSTEIKKKRLLPQSKKPYTVGNKNLKPPVSQVSKSEPPTKMAQGPKGKFPFEEEDEILLVGEGNFSFAASLAEELKSAEKIISTCFDSEQTLHEKYHDAKEFVQSLVELDGNVVYEVDCCQLSKTKLLKKMKFDKIVFNFPHGKILLIRRAIRI